VTYAALLSTPSFHASHPLFHRQTNLAADVELLQRPSARAGCRPFSCPGWLCQWRSGVGRACSVQEQLPLVCLPHGVFAPCFLFVAVACVHFLKHYVDLRFVKYELRGKGCAPWLAWSQSDPCQLFSVTCDDSSGGKSSVWSKMIFSWYQIVQPSFSSSANSRLGTIVIVDGHKLLITPSSMCLLPPPMLDTAFNHTPLHAISSQRRL
jgi:hypothetical protein